MKRLLLTGSFLTASFFGILSPVNGQIFYCSQVGAATFLDTLTSTQISQIRKAGITVKHCHDDRKNKVRKYITDPLPPVEGGGSVNQGTVLYLPF